MRLVIFTSNAIRHKYLANTLAKHSDDCLIISEAKPLVQAISADNSLISAHFALRDETEADFFSGNDVFNRNTLALVHGEANSSYAYSVIKDFKPGLMLVYGASIIREPLLSLLKPGRFLNLHLGLSPFYRGSGTNFFPFVNRELEYVGSTILHIDAGIDTGDIVTHVLPRIEPGDNVHTVGCKVIVNSVEVLGNLLDKLKAGKELNRVKQWKVEGSRYYRKKDFNEDVLRTYLSNLQEGMVEDYCRNPVRLPGLIEH